MRSKRMLRTALCVASAIAFSLAVPAWGKKGQKEEAHRIADFTEDALAAVEARHMTTTRMPADKRSPTPYLRCTLEAGKSWARLKFKGVPKDLRPWYALRFRIRGRDVPAKAIRVRLCNSGKTYIGTRLEGVSKKWKDVELRIAAMRAGRNFDPEDLRSLRFVWFDTTAQTLDLDDVRLVRGPSGWRYSEEEFRKHLFGKARIRKVRHIETEHFDVYTDSAAARKKFPKALETTYLLVRETLGVGEMKGRLPVYIFQNPNLYFDFCVRYAGDDREAAERTSGHGSGQYFATFYQSPTAPTVTHELTHSIFHRTVGRWGGSWFQEGVAVYVEELAQGRSAARLFAPKLRGRRHLALREFFGIPRLVDSEDPTGGPRDASSLYAQAGALFEFLLRGLLERRPKETETGKRILELPEKLRALARVRADPEKRANEVARILGLSIEDLEARWIEWGSDPPERKER